MIYQNCKYYFLNYKRTKKYVKFVLSFIFLFSFFVVPFGSLLAQNNETNFSAEIVTVDPDGILEAKGNVVIRYGDITVKAASVVIDNKKNKIKFSDIKNLSDSQSLELGADSALINRDFSIGIISAANILIDETIKIKAGEVRLTDGKITSAKNITKVTSCGECDGKEPNWYLNASSAKRDVAKSNIVYKNVTVRVKGLPIAYIPYLRMPDPSVDRALGFLVPEAVLTSNLATGLKLPYFIPIGLSNDLLVTPYFSSKTKTIEYRYRQKFQNGI